MLYAPDPPDGTVTTVSTDNVLYGLAVHDVGITTTAVSISVCVSGAISRVAFSTINGLTGAALEQAIQDLRNIGIFVVEE
jgi:hypothetical protein